jgi:hypothetical protein
LNNPYQLCSGIKVEHNLVGHIVHAVGRRDNFDSEIRRQLKIGRYFVWQAVRPDEGGIRCDYHVRVTAEDISTVRAGHMTKLLGTDVHVEHRNDPCG